MVVVVVVVVAAVAVAHVAINTVELRGTDR